MATTKKPVKKATPKSKKTAVKRTASKVATLKQEVKKTVSKVESKDKSVNVLTPTRFAVIELAGTQIKVTVGGKYTVSKINLEKGKTVEVSNVLMVVDGDDIKIGKPYVEGAKVVLEIDSQKKDQKVKVFKYKAKSRYRRTRGHRAEITRVAVKEIKA